jgi:hypothetical protein
MVKRRLGDHVGAIADLRAAVALDPDDAEAVAELRAYEAAVAAGRLRPRAGRTLAGPPPSGKGIHSDAAPPSQSPRDSRPTSSDRAHKGKCRR